MSWKRAHGPVRCLGVGCDTTVGDGGVYYRNRYDMDYSEPCGRRLFQTAPPEMVDDAPTKLVLPPTLARFSKQAVADDVRGRILDWRARQAGER